MTETRYDAKGRTPAEIVVADRLPQVELRAEISAATAALLKALRPAQRHLWLQMEELLNSFRLERETAFLDVGYEQGLAAGWAEAAAIGNNDQVRALTEAIIQTVVDSGMPPATTISAVAAVIAGIASGIDNTAKRNASRITTQDLHR